MKTILLALSAAASMPLSADVVYVTMDHAGFERHYVYQEPQGPGPYNLLLSLHGRSGTGPGFASRVLTHEWGALSSPETIVVYPTACTNPIFGQPVCDGTGASVWQARDDDKRDVDDIGFLVEIISDITSIYEIDRTYMTGLSSGGMITYRMSCSGAYNFDAYMPYQATHKISSCPFPPVSGVHHIHGDADTIVPFSWAESDIRANAVGCTLPAQYIGQEAIEGGMVVDHLEYSGCDIPASVSLIQGGIHGATEAAQNVTYNELLMRAIQ